MNILKISHILIYLFIYFFKWKLADREQNISLVAIVVNMKHIDETIIIYQKFVEIKVKI